MSSKKSAGTNLPYLLRDYGCDTVFGMPGVHTLEAYRGLNDAGIRHIGVRHEQGAGFMADGYARVSGKPGVCLLISGPGITNASTPIGQAYSDSQPMLVISSVAAVRDLNMGRGRLHEISDQARVSEPLTGFSAVALTTDQIQEHVARAFALFASQRPRPVHIAIPLDVLEVQDGDDWKARAMPSVPAPAPEAIKKAAALLNAAERPVLLCGGGSIGASAQIRKLAERVGAAVIPTIAGKGVIPDNHPLAVEATLERPATQKFVEQADVVLAIGTELAEPDLWLEKALNLSGEMIRVDLDPQVLSRDYDPSVAICADASLTLDALLEVVGEKPKGAGFAGGSAIADLRKAERDTLSPLEKKHVAVLDGLRRAMPANGMVFTDMTQIAYTGYCYYRCNDPKTWFFPAGYGTLGYALPAAIGGKLAAPERPTAVLVGDGGFQFTLQELGTAVEQKLPMAIILWNNNSLAQIRDGMTARKIPTIGVNQHNPVFADLARAYGAKVAQPKTIENFEAAVSKALFDDGPTVIEVFELDIA